MWSTLEDLKWIRKKGRKEKACMFSQLQRIQKLIWLFSLHLWHNIMKLISIFVTLLKKICLRLVFLFVFLANFYYFIFFVFCLCAQFFAIFLTSAETKCEQLSSQASANGLVGAYVPQCNVDGSFSSEQCWGSTGFCWCVDEYGKEIPGTKIRGKPDCSKKGNLFP